MSICRRYITFFTGPFLKMGHLIFIYLHLKDVIINWYHYYVILYMFHCFILISILMAVCRFPLALQFLPGSIADNCSFVFFWLQRNWILLLTTVSNQSFTKINYCIYLSQWLRVESHMHESAFSSKLVSMWAYFSHQAMFISYMWCVYDMGVSATSFHVSTVYDPD